MAAVAQAALRRPVRGGDRARPRDGARPLEECSMVYGYQRAGTGWRRTDEVHSNGPGGSRRPLGEGARLWLVEAASAGTSRVKVKMAEAVELARLHGQVHVDWALGHAATYGRFADGDLASILSAHPIGDRRSAGEGHSLQSGTRAWEGFGGPQ